MKRIAACLILAAFAAPLYANPFPGADPKAGHKLMEKAHCDACHASLAGGDGSAIYTRADRKVKSAQGLLAQVRFCSTQLNANWFPEDEENVAAYLNQQYYKFK